MYGLVNNNVHVLQVAKSSVGFILFLFTRSRSKVISDDVSDGGGGCVRTINNDSNNIII